MGKEKDELSFPEQTPVQKDNEKLALEELGKGSFDGPRISDLVLFVNTAFLGNSKMLSLEGVGNLDQLEARMIEEYGEVGVVTLMREFLHAQNQ